MMKFDDPLAFEEFLIPLGGDVLIRPAVGTSFSAKIAMQKLGSVKLFTITANSFRVRKEPQQDFYGLTLPLSAPFSTSTRDQIESYRTSIAHMLSPGDAFDLTCTRKTHFLVCNFFVDPVQEYSNKLMQSDLKQFHKVGPNIHLNTQAGGHLLRTVMRAWTTLINGTTLNNDIYRKELEDELFSGLFLYATQEKNQIRPPSSTSTLHVNRAEEFICANLTAATTRDQIAEVCGTSIRSLSRGFEKRYGVGPMGFLRQRRFDAVYVDLLRADPESTTVSQIAMDYGFSHLGQFAIQYRKVFGESPSESLAKQP